MAESDQPVASLLVAAVGFDAAKHAVMNWHYSRVMPAGKLVKHGVWENGRYIGAVIYGRGATPRLTGQFGLEQTECVELVRVALRDHIAPVSQIMSASVRILRQSNPGLRLIVSFADPLQGHVGVVYQAGNWTYTGTGHEQPYYRINGARVHARTVYARGWSQKIGWLREHIDPHAAYERSPGKHRYVLPLDRAMRRRVATMAQPYPAAVQESTVTRDVTGVESRVRAPGTAQRPLARRRSAGAS